MAKSRRPTGTREWASETDNCQTGCSHDCKYCYAKERTIRYGRVTAENWVNAVVRDRDVKKKRKKIEGTVMFPSFHDIDPNNIDVCIEVIRKHLVAGNKMLIVSKPHTSCVMAMCREFQLFRDQILFRFTIGSANNEVLKFWEPHAPSFDERLQALEIAYNKGFQTSVSCEPMLDEHIDKVVELVEPFVTDAIWLGKMNSCEHRVKANGHTDKTTTDWLKALMRHQDNDENIFDLYERYKDNPKIKWKDSIKKVVGIEAPAEIGLDE